MGVDVLVLNTAVADFRSEVFSFADDLVGPGGLAKCPTKDMPPYTQAQYRRWIEAGLATTGGPGNSAPLMARAGLRVAVGVNLGKGDFDGLDAQGRFFQDVMTANGIDMSLTCVHPTLPTGTTFIYEKGGAERGGIAYFPNANNDFDFAYFRKAVEKLSPKIVYYMYSGLSDRGDANGGRDLAEFIAWCRGRDAVTIVDSHTLTGDPQALIDSGQPVPEYALLKPLLSEVDIFFTSFDEAKMIGNTLGIGREWRAFLEPDNCVYFLNALAQRFWHADRRTRLFGVTVSNGAYERHITRSGAIAAPSKTESRFMAGEVIDLVGAGDSFRAGLLTYIAQHLKAFADGSMDFSQAVQMGNLFAALFIKAPLRNRYGNIKPYAGMLHAVQSGRQYATLDDLMKDLNSVA